MTPRTRTIVLAVALVVLVALPSIGVAIPGVFEGALNAPGTLNLLGLCFVFGALALTYDLVFGYVGLLSFGHALYFATGVYTTAIALTRWHWSLPAALALTALMS
ncbi:MAG: branched-chain amino acid ABC transporter permease, partial [Candidatus Eremiobacteraeota bacterium]|nr:branched-chain amino acid ABC transporter permease [Candidatus Eremiobacteraeota bacterium]